MTDFSVHIFNLALLLSFKFLLLRAPFDLLSLPARREHEHRFVLPTNLMSNRSAGNFVSNMHVFHHQPPVSNVMPRLLQG